ATRLFPWIISPQEQNLSSLVYKGYGNWTAQAGNHSNVSCYGRHEWPYLRPAVHICAPHPSAIGSTDENTKSAGNWAGRGESVDCCRCTGRGGKRAGDKSG